MPVLVMPADHDNRLAIADNRIFNMFDSRGNLINRFAFRYGYAQFIDYCPANKRFGIVSLDIDAVKGYLHVTDYDGNLLGTMSVTQWDIRDVVQGIKLLPHSVIICGLDCTRFTFKRKEIWRTTLPSGASDNPAAYKGYVYVPLSDEHAIYILDLKNGKIVRKLPMRTMDGYIDWPMYVKTCGAGKLAAIGFTSVIFYDLSEPSRPRPIISFDIETENAVYYVTDDCKYVVIADGVRGVVDIYSSRGEQLFTKELPKNLIEELEDLKEDLASVALWHGNILLGTADRLIRIPLY